MTFEYKWVSSNLNDTLFQMNYSSTFLSKSISLLSTVSFRSLPEPSLEEIKKICQHYEAKCSGQYNSLGSRYVLELAKEIKSQIDGMEKLSNNDSTINLSRASQTSKKPRKRQGSWLEDILSSTTAPLDHLGTSIPFLRKSSHDETKSGFVCRRPSNPSSTSHSNPNLYRSTRPKSASFCHSSQEIPQDQQVRQLTQMLLQKDSELQFVKEDAVHAIEIHRKQFQIDLEEEKSKWNCMKEIMEQNHQNVILKKQREVERVKNDAKLVIDFVRRKANKAIEEEKSKGQVNRQLMENKFLEMELRMKELFNSKLQKAETVIQKILSQQRFQVEKKNHEAPSQCVPSPLPPKKTKLKKYRLHLSDKDKVSTVNTRISNDSTCRGRDSDESISTRSSMETSENDNGGSLEPSRNEIVNEGNTKSIKSDKEDEDMATKNKWFLDRLDELEEWTDALTLAIETDRRKVMP